MNTNFSSMSPHPRASARHHTLVVVATVVAVALVVVLVMFLQGDRPGGSGSIAPPTNTATTTGPTTSPTTAPTTAPTSSPPTRTTGATASSQLQSFFRAAVRMDGQLRAAAVKINGAGPPWRTVSEEVARSVRAANLEPVAKEIPGGMPKPLLLSVMSVYHDLSARRAAMNSFSNAGSYGPLDDPDADPMSTKNLLSYLANGAPPAARFASDLATARTRALSYAPFTTAKLGSRADMEVQLYIELEFKENFGCNAHGSPNPLTHLTEISWKSPNGGIIGEGELNAPFEIRLEPDGTYTEDPINVC